MHYYQFNIGDYMSHTKGLKPFEDLAYRRMLDEIYLHETPLPLSSEDIARQIGLPDSQKEVEYVLGKYFVKTPKGYMNSRAKKEIKIFHDKKKQKKKAGVESGKARRLKALNGGTGVEQTLNECSTNDELNNNQEPITNNHKPINKKQTKDKSPAVALDYSCWPELPSDQVLTDWLDMRKRLKANVSQTVINNFSTELRKAQHSGHSVDHCLSECVTRNWRGFKYSWIQEASQNASYQRPHRESLSERANRAADEAFGTGSQSGVLEGCFDIVDEDGSDPFAGSGPIPDLGGRSV